MPLSELAQSPKGEKCFGKKKHVWQMCSMCYVSILELNVRKALRYSSKELNNNQLH